MSTTTNNSVINKGTNMPTINIYLTFDGNCREAFDFYKSIFGGEYDYISTFGEMPEMEGMPPIPEESKEKIMHVSLPISKETTLMGSDRGGPPAPEVVQGNNFSVSINCDSPQEATRFFNFLSEGGEIVMPLGKMFWGAYYGMFTDKFGINWMVNAELPR
jgi:PhnB protein